MPYNIIFFGTSDFSTPSLQALITDARFSVKAVVTKPDMKVGRHQEIIEPPVKTMAKKNGIPVIQFESVKAESSYEILKRVQDEPQGIDAYVVVSYGKIIPQRVLDLPKFGVINVHGSLLPKHRGASCVQSAIACGDKETGVTIMLMDAEMDHGPTLEQKKTEIKVDDTGGMVHDRLACIGALLLTDTLAGFIEHKIEPTEQAHHEATYCKILKREDGKIDWSKTASEIERLVRAYDPWPGTFCYKDDKRIKILKTRISNYPLDCARDLREQRTAISEPGDWVVDDEKLYVVCGGGSKLEILELQPEGKRRVIAKDYLAGNKLK
ncbi:MAG: methionyl-tRNA formyltransferase [Patescibacteria group bacterium]|nr:methionyl-tRNA formyltransferase [Patescibacteria group bacterium]